MKKKIILSYDYELFFGQRSGTVLKTIIEPTYRLLDIMESVGLRGNFFVDYLMFRELEKQKDVRAQHDLKLLKKQIKDIVRRGHRIELHLHPHWLDAKYNGDGTWNFDDFTHYSLSSLDENVITDLFVKGATYLNLLAMDVDATYRVVAFRAGGWAVQPFDKIKAGFMESGILIDSSTSYGIYKNMKDSFYDFRCMPEKCLYRFEEDVCEEKIEGRFIEVPITSFHRNLFLVLVDRFYGGKLHYFDKISDGTHFRLPEGEGNCKIGIKERLRKKIMFSLSMQSAITIKWALLNHKRQDIYCYIDHPKDFSKATEKGILTLGERCESVHYIDLIK